MSEGITREYTIQNLLGLHARAAATLVRVTSQFACEVSIARGKQAVNGKSILGVMTLAAAKGAVIQVTCSGADEGAAQDAIGAIIEQKFNEE